MMEAGCDPNTSPSTDASERTVSGSGSSSPSTGAVSPVTGSVSGSLTLAVSPNQESRASSTDSGHGSSPESSTAPGSSQNLPPELACLRSPKKLEENKLPSNADVLRHCVHTRKFSPEHRSQFTDPELVKQVSQDIVDTWQKLGKPLKTRAKLYRCDRNAPISMSNFLLSSWTFYETL